MHKNGYVMAVMADGRVLDEDGSSKVYLPFGTEYKVRMINKNYDRCAADLLINGDKIARFILAAGETADIERYVDDNLHGGSRFKFTHLHDSAVKDKNSLENGIVEVLYYKEKYRKPEPIIIREEHHHWPPWKDPNPYPKWPWPNTPVYMSNGDNMVFGATCNNASYGTDMPQLRAMNCSMQAPSAAEGATVRGSRSEQKFKEVSGLEFESIPVTIKLKIFNGELQTVVKYCTRCGRKKIGNDKFCSNCGSKY